MTAHLLHGVCTPILEENFMGRNDELKIQAHAFRYLRNHGVFCHSIPNEADGRSIISQKQLMAAGLTPGVADMLAWFGEKGKPEIVYIEFKTATGKQSDYQKAFERKCAEWGVRYFLCRSLDDVKSVAREMGVKE